MWNSNDNSKKKQAVVFGCGRIGQKSLLTIQKDYKVEFFVDNNSQKWGENFEGFKVCSPNNLSEYKGVVIIATALKTALLISEQLLMIGINKKDILIINCYEKGKYEVLQYDPMDYEREIREIIVFDCLKKKEQISHEEKKLALFTLSYDVYSLQLIRFIKKYYPQIKITLITVSDEYCADFKEFVEHIYLFRTIDDLIQILNSIPSYDVFQLLKISDYWIYLRNLIKEKCGRLCLMMQGSDFYRADEEQIVLNKALIEIVDCMSVQSEDVKRDFLNVYPDMAERVEVVNYGLEVIDHLAEIEHQQERKRIIFKNLGIPSDKIIVLCGHNSGEAHQHRKMIEAIYRMEEPIKERICFVFPMTYGSGDAAYIKSIKDMLEVTKLNYRILTKFMDFDEMACLAEITDVMIHVQTTDQLSSTMLEHMYAGSLIIAGSWLPYQWLRDEGVFFLSTERIYDITSILSQVVLDLSDFVEKCNANRQKIRKLCSWSNVINKWFNMWFFTKDVLYITDGNNK